MHGVHGWPIKKHGVTSADLAEQRKTQHAEAVEREQASLAAFAALRIPGNLRGGAVRAGVSVAVSARARARTRAPGWNPAPQLVYACGVLTARVSLARELLRSATASGSR